MVYGEQHNRWPDLRSYSSRYFAPGVILFAAALLAAGIFVLDAVTSVNVVVSDLHVVVVLMASRVLRPRDILLVASGCILLAVVSHFIAWGNPWSLTSLINLLFVCSTIGLAAFVISRNASTALALRQAQHQLAHFARVTTLAELTASLSHELSQPVSAVIMNAQACSRWLSAEPPNLEEARKATECISKNGNRAVTLIHQVRNMIKKSPRQTVWIDINHMIQETLALVHAEVLRHRAILETQLMPNLPAVQGDRVQLQQVILNLVLNALEATDANGEAPRKIVVATALEDATALRVTVSDSGKGLDPKELEQIFDAFYTTKPLGMGMGLAVSRSIIQAHSGRLWATPNAPRGAVFNFTMPITRQPLPVAASQLARQ
ncbi:MAG TPA: ATP-binding protein [Acidocella sp.]|jgi:signal transduction histidine kinase|nr:ATP-binding protein [Acidocella sp.]